MASIGIPGLILILLLALLMFGPSKLPELGKAVGRTLSEFKKGTRGIMDVMDDEPVRKSVGSNNDSPPAVESKSDPTLSSARIQD